MCCNYAPALRVAEMNPFGDYSLSSCTCTCSFTRVQQLVSSRSCYYREAKTSTQTYMID